MGINRDAARHRGSARERLARSVGFGGLRGLVVLLAVSLVLVTATSGSPPPHGSQSTVIIGEDISGVDSLDPQQQPAVQGSGIIHQLYANLVTFPKDDVTRVVPMVAESWTATGANVWTFHVKKGLKFNNGDEVTAADFLFSVQRLVSMTPSPSAWLVGQFGIDKNTFSETVQAPDKYTVRIKMLKPMSPMILLSVLAWPSTGIVDAAVAKQHIVNNDWGTKWLAEHSAGAGGYQAASVSRDNQIVLTANPYYNVGPAPRITRVIYRNVPEPVVQNDLLVKGELDLARDLTGQQLLALAEDSRVKLIRVPSVSLVYLAMNNMTVPAFGSREVRQAVKYALDYDGIVHKLLYGNALVEQSIIPKGLFGYDARTPFSPRNVAQAKKLLAAAGYPNGFSVDLLVSTGSMPGGITSSVLATKVQSDLADIGIRVSIRAVEFARLFQLFRGQAAQMVINRWDTGYADADGTVKPFADYDAKSLAWRVNYNNRSLIALIEKAGSMPNTPERAQLYRQISETSMFDGPFAILYQPMQTLAMRNTLRDVQYNPMFNDIELVKLGKQ